MNDIARKAFFESKSLDFEAGYAVLFGQSPDFTKEAEESNYFTRRITAVLKRDRLQKGLALPITSQPD